MGETLGSPEPKPAVSASLYSQATPPTESYTQSATRPLECPSLTNPQGKKPARETAPAAAPAHPAEGGGLNPEEGSYQNE